MSINCDKALGAGLSFRPLNETVRDTLTWRETNHLSEELKAGIETDKEHTVLRKWHETHA
jgi:2'-hydroxyisoflavone reductase